MRISVNSLFIQVDPETREVGLSRNSGTDFVFMDMNDNVTETILPNTKYVFGTIINNVFLVMHKGTDGVLRMVNEREVNTLGRVYFVPPFDYPGTAGFSRFIYTTPGSLVWPGSNDTVLLENVSMNIECVRDCTNKKCNESDGCGSICGCGVGNTCMPDGTCEVQQPNQQSAFCVTEGKGTCTGRCFGTCSAGATCTQTNGIFSCKMSMWSTTFVWVLFAILIFITLIFLAS